MIGKKIEMSQEFAADGMVIPVTVLHAGPVVVTQVKNAEKDGYQAVQVGFGTRKAKRVSKSVRGHLKELGPFAVLKEFRTTEPFQRGQTITADVFAPGDFVDVTGISIGRGFAGVVKRHGFHGSPASHGHKDQLRMPGSLASKRQGAVEKGKRMGGHMGHATVTTKNLEVVAVDSKTHEMKLKGAVPGARGSVVFIKTAKNAR